MLNADLAFKLSREAVCNLGDYDILPPICINKDRSCYNEK